MFLWIFGVLPKVAGFQTNRTETVSDDRRSTLCARWFQALVGRVSTLDMGSAGYLYLVRNLLNHKGEL